MSAGDQETQNEPDNGEERVNKATITISDSTKIDEDFYGRRSSTTGKLAKKIVDTFCYSVVACLVFTFVQQIANYSTTRRAMDTIAKGINTKYPQNSSDEELIATNKNLIESNNQAIKTLEKISEQELNNSWELFKNFGAVMAGPLGFY